VPGSLRGDDGGYIPQPKAYEYNPPSVFTRHKTLTILFGSAILVLLVYWFVWVRKMPAGMYIPPSTSVYIQDLSAPAPATAPAASHAEPPAAQAGKPPH
jgi:hypothetical protein